MNIVIKIGTALTALLMTTMSGTAMAHSGSHDSEFMLWFAHMLSSVDHITALLGLTMLLASTWAVLRMPQRYRRWLARSVSAIGVVIAAMLAIH